MMVSKIAVIALVGIVAVPILLGYALNLTESTESDYRAVGESVNVTSLLQNGTAYTYSHADTYQLNTNFGDSYFPYFESVNYVKSSLPMEKLEINWNGLGTQPFSNISYYYIEPHYDHSVQDISAEIIQNGSSLTTYHNFDSLYYDASAGIIKVKYYQSGQYSSVTITGGNFDGVTFNNTQSWIKPYTIVEYASSSTNTYVDFAAGFQFQSRPYSWQIILPNHSKTALITIDLDSVTDTNYSLKLGHVAGYIWLEKTTDGLGNVTWSIRDFNNYEELYYDPNGDNVYQLKTNIDFLGSTPEEPNYDCYETTFEFRYVGSWPSLIGEANHYQDYDITRRSYYAKGSTVVLDHLNFILESSDTIYASPIMRMDDAFFRAFQYAIIQDKTYSPSSFKTNPLTKITDIQLFGNSIEFGGSTFAVTDGKITLSSQKVPVDKLSFYSIPNTDLGGYDNMIGNTFISNTAEPSTISFNGQWSASISTQSMESYTYTKTEWHAGEFGWDGIDQNFLIVGLITCLGVFVGLGIYARKRGTGGIIPLMIVVGGAAMVFFVML